MFFDDLLYHSFILPYIAVEETVLQVAVGMPVTQHPPPRSRRAALPHRALASGHDAHTLRGRGMQDVGWRQPLGCEGV
jgi:hypothetical protein